VRSEPRGEHDRRRHHGEQPVRAEPVARARGHGTGGDDARPDRPRPELRQVEAETKKALCGEGHERAGRDEDERDEDHEPGGEERVISAGHVLPDCAMGCTSSA